MKNGQIPRCTCAAKIEPREYKTLQQNYDKQWDWGSYKIIPISKSTRANGFIVEFYQTCKENLTELLKIFHEIESEATQTHATKPVLHSFQT
jgi:hypothetical protein